MTFPETLRMIKGAGFFVPDEEGVWSTEGEGASWNRCLIAALQLI